MSEQELLAGLLDSIRMEEHSCDFDGAAHLEIHHNQVLGAHLVPGLTVEPLPFENGVEVKMIVHKGVKIEKPVRICFGMLPESGIQKIIMKTFIEEDSSVSVLAHCTFPNAVDVQHLMEGQIAVG